MEVPRKFWGEALRSASYLVNRTPSRELEFKTPLQTLRELTKTQISEGLVRRIFGCTTYVHQNLGKLEPRSVRCMFLGYADAKKGYRCFDPVENKVHVTRDVAFHETIPFFGHACSLQGEREEKEKEEKIHDVLEMCNIEHVVHDVDVEEEGNGDSAHVNTAHAHVDTSSTSTEPQSSTQVELPDLQGREDKSEPEIQEPEVRNTINSPEVDPDPGYFDTILQDINEEEEAGSE